MSFFNYKRCSYFLLCILNNSLTIIFGLMKYTFWNCTAYKRDSSFLLLRSLDTAASFLSVREKNQMHVHKNMVRTKVDRKLQWWNTLEVKQLICYEVHQNDTAIHSTSVCFVVQCTNLTISVNRGKPVWPWTILFDFGMVTGGVWDVIELLWLTWAVFGHHAHLVRLQKHKGGCASSPRTETQWKVFSSCSCWQPRIWGPA